MKKVRVEDHEKKRRKKKEEKIIQKSEKSSRLQASDDRAQSKLP